MKRTIVRAPRECDCKAWPFCEHHTPNAKNERISSALDNHCIADGCCAAFDSSEPETRDINSLRSFWTRYCPKHRTGGNAGSPVFVNQPQTPDIAPGPWRAEGWENLVVNDANGNTIALMPGANYGLKTAKATAALMSAAFDLLIQLEGLVGQIEASHYLVVPQGVRDAIAKAKGVR